MRMEDIYPLCECIGQYINESNDNVEMHDVLAQIHRCLEYGVWFLYRREEVVGFLVGNIQKDQYGKTVCFVEYLFVNKEARLKGYARRLAEIGIAWVRQMKVKKILFGTRRNARAMCRFLPGNWKIDSTVISLCV